MSLIGFTGTQAGMTPEQKKGVSALLGLATTRVASEVEFHHGDCVGADAEAHEIASGLGFSTIVHPPEDSKKRAGCLGNIIRPPRSYRERNQDIVNMTDFLIAAPKTMQEEIRSGTWMTVRMARKAARTIFIVWPDGTVKVE